MQNKDNVGFLVRLPIFVASFGRPLSKFLKIGLKLSKGILRRGFAFDVEGECVVLCDELTCGCEREVFLAVDENVFVEGLSR